jgi:glycosyltransferase involved in cell wall biosynthesis
MKVLHVIPSISPLRGGPSAAIVAMESALIAAGLSMTIVTTDDDGAGRRLSGLNRTGGHVQLPRVYAPKRADTYMFAPGLFPWLWNNIKSYDIVHIHGMFQFPSSVAGILAGMRGVPYVIRPYGTLAAYGISQRRPRLKQASIALLEARLLRRAAAIHFTSKVEQVEAEALGIPLKSVVIPLGVAHSPDTAQYRAGQVPNKIPVILFMSRLDPKKNIETLLEAFAATLVGRDAELWIAGSGSPAYLAVLQERSCRLGIQGRVQWLSHVDGAEKQRVLATADIFVLPSFSENFGIAAVEALLAGLPCIIGKGVAIAAQASDAGAALMVDPTTGSVADAIATLLDNPSKLALLGAKARPFALREYSVEAMADNLVCLYRSILAGGDIPNLQSNPSRIAPTEHPT